MGFISVAIYRRNGYKYEYNNNKRWQGPTKNKKGGHSHRRKTEQQQGPRTWKTCPRNPRRKDWRNRTIII